MSTDAPDLTEWIWDQVSDLDYAHAAKVLGIPMGWLREKVPAKAIPCTRYGRHVRFTPDDIAEIRRMNRQPVTESAIEPDEARRARFLAAVRAQQSRAA